MTNVIARIVLAASVVGVVTAASAAPRFDRYATMPRDRIYSNASMNYQEMPGGYYYYRQDMEQAREPIEVQRTRTLSGY